MSIETTQEKISQMDYDLRTLKLWEAAEAQGIDSSEGGRFGLDTRLLNPVQRNKYHQYRQRYVAQDGAIKVFNYFRYPNGDVAKLDPMLEAVHRN